MIRNVIFDWSGTLVDDLPAVWDATNHVFRQAGVPPLTLEAFRHEFCLPFSRFYERFTPGVPMEQLETWYHARFREVQDQVEELPHARAFLEFCRKRQLRTFLLSTIRGDHFAEQTRKNGFDGFLDRCYVEAWDKTATIHRLLDENQLDPSETLFIGDMQHDVDTARHGGVRSCAVLTGFTPLVLLRESKPDLIVEHLGELHRLLSESELHFPPDQTRVATGRMPIATVGGLIFDAQGKVLMIRTHKWSGLWGIPGGKIKWGETSEAALRRELKEETGLDVEEIRFVLVQDCIHSEEFYKDAHFLLLNYTCVASGRDEVILNEEAEEFRWVALQDALGMNLNQPTRTLVTNVMSTQAGLTRSSRSSSVAPLVNRL